MLTLPPVMQGDGGKVSLHVSLQVHSGTTNMMIFGGGVYYTVCGPCILLQHLL